MNKPTVAQAVESAAVACGKLFAQSETNASESLEMFARLVGDTPTYEVFERERLAWVNGYVEVKPKTTSDAAYQAFGRFKNRLVETYGVEVPKSKSAAAEKKRAEREAKQVELLKRYEAQSDDALHSLIVQAYERAARNPLSSDANLKELKAVLKARTKDHQAEAKAELKAKRDEVIKVVRACSDLSRLDLALEVLDNGNDVDFLTQ
jgi:hypothetical protein